MNISNIYNLGLSQSKLDFVDVKLHKDNKLFVDPRLIEISQNPLVVKMQHNLKVFLAELLDNIKADNKKNIKYLMSGLGEPKETRLGHSEKNFDGNSVGDKLKPKFQSALSDSVLLKYGVLNNLGDFDLFIDDIGCDRISDITTKIIKSVLIEYTQDQCLKSSTPIPMIEVHQKYLFDIDKLRWTEKKVNLPVYLGKPIIFVPKDIVRRKNDANSNLGSFYRYAIRNFIANDKELIEDVKATGKNDLVLLRDIKLAYPSSKESSQKWLIRFPKLLVDYKSNFLNPKLRPLTDDEIEAIVYHIALSEAS
ncbi:hypothetical protein [Flavobacterium sp. ENC]|uniref:hypothetical protein n=1 Tax=Flavobacterium sp. ENC TaxID=2897330 RepID=UPI001E3A54B7|nr:hypothetical protein [Flavobacterium sp. ENC]MCD0465863.1 hypothetical protein [Flavobacterium sp. ENC]